MKAFFIASQSPLQKPYAMRMEPKFSPRSVQLVARMINLDA